MATAGVVRGDSDTVLIGVVPCDPDPDPKLSVWIGRDTVTEITLANAEILAGVLLDAVKVAKGEAELMPEALRLVGSGADVGHEPSAR